jgi:hypothetical protein
MTVYLGSDDDGPTPGTSAGGVDLFPDVLSHAASLRVIDHPIGFYRREGFEVIGLIPDANGPGKPDVLMAKRIGPNPQGSASHTQGHRCLAPVKSPFHSRRPPSQRVPGAPSASARRA